MVWSFQALPSGNSYTAGGTCIWYNRLENWQRLRQLNMLIPKDAQFYHQVGAPRHHVQRLIKDTLESSER